MRQAVCGEAMGRSRREEEEEDMGPLVAMIGVVIVVVREPA
jgi:hypothetical protein